MIDDDPGQRTLIGAAFEREGYQVRLADDGRSGMLSFAAEPADLVVTDIFMPDKEGLETISELRLEKDVPKIVAISGGGSLRGVNVLRLAKLLGADATMSKPLNLSLLLDVARRLLEQRATESMVSGGGSARGRRRSAA